MSVCNAESPVISAKLEKLLWPQHTFSDESIYEFMRNYNISFPKSIHSCKPDERDKNTFRLTLNVKQFKPSDVEVKLVQDDIVVHCKHDLKVDEHGYVSREFTRRIKIPEDVERDSFKSNYNKNGLLIIRALRKAVKTESDDGTIIPVELQKPIESALVTDAELESDEADDSVLTRSTETEYIVRDIIKN